MSNLVPDGWSTSKLGDVAKLTMGQSPSSDTYNTEMDGLPFFQGKADFGSRYPKVRYWCTDPSKVASKQSILFSVRAPVGEVNITPYECCIGRGLAGIQGETADQEFLFQKLQYVKPRFQLLSQGSTFEAVNGGEMREFDLTLPPLPEQQKIATILSSVDDVIEKTRAQIDKLKDLKTGMMQELLTKGIGHTEFKSSDVGQIPKSWACELVSNLFEIQLGKMLSQAAKVGVSPLPYLGNKDVQWGKINVTDLQTMDFSERERKKFLLKLGDLLMCEGGEVGRSAIWEGELKECYYQKALHRLRPINKAYEPRLLLEYMRYAKGQNLLADFISQTSIAHLTREKLSAIPVPVPPVAEQKRIVDVIASIDTRINRHLDKLKNTCDIKKALMQDLLTGKVRVKLTDLDTEAAS